MARITQSSMSRNYINNLNTTLTRYNKSMDKVSSGRKFTKMSEAVADGSRALRIRAQLYRNEQMQRNVSSVQEELNVAETNMMSVKGVLDTAHEQAVKVQNGINEPENEYQIYSSIFSSYEDQIFQWSNAVYGDKYLFSGTQNSEPPFAYNDQGALTYNGIEVSEIYKSDDGDFVYDQTVETSPGVFATKQAKVPYSDDIFVDIGLNVTVNGTLLEEKSAFNISVSGLDAFGFGTTDTTYQSTDGNVYTYSDEPSPNVITIDESDMTTASSTIDITFDGETKTFDLSGTDANDIMKNLQAAISSEFGDDVQLVEDTSTGVWTMHAAKGSVLSVSGDGVSGTLGLDSSTDAVSIDNSTYGDAIPNNICEIFNQMAKALDEQDMNRFAALDLQLQSQSAELMIEVSDVGVRGNYLSSTLSRYEDEELTLTEMQTNVENINDAEEITTMRTHEYAWNLTLQFGSSFLPMSLMDYLV